MADIAAALADAFPEGADENGTQEETAAPADAGTVEAAEVTAEEAPKERLYAGKYKSIEELEKAWDEQEKFITRQKDEVGKARAEAKELKDEFEALRQQMQSQSPPPFAEQQWPTEAVYEKPGRARATAIWLAQHQPEALDDFISEWHDYDSRSAAGFEREVELAQLRAEYDEKFASVQNLPKEIEADKQQQAATQTFNQVWADLKAQFPDLDEVGDQIVAEAREAPELAAVFGGTDGEAQKRVLTTLYRAAQARRLEAQTEADRQTQEEADNAVKQAQVVTATQSAGSRKPPKRNDPFMNTLDKAFADLA